MKYRSTSPSSYYERQIANQHTTWTSAPRRTREADYGTIVGFTFTACYGFILGMVITLAIVGVL